MSADLEVMLSAGDVLGTTQAWPPDVRTEWAMAKVAGDFVERFLVEHPNAIVEVSVSFTNAATIFQAAPGEGDGYVRDAEALLAQVIDERRWELPAPSA